MRVILIDIDTLRKDHLGCYGYKRNTSPAMDEIARHGTAMDHFYTPNAPCLPSRCCLQTGMYGIHSGVVGHGGTAADLRLQGDPRDFQDEVSQNSLFSLFKRAGMHTVSFSTFPERHSAWWFNAGLKEWHNVGKCGGENADEVTTLALDWLKRNEDKDNWFMHYHVWDPHTPYRAPESFGNPFENEPLCDDWITEDILKEHRKTSSPHGACEIGMFNSDYNPDYPRHPGEVKTVAEVKNLIDQYDCGIRYADDNIQKLVDELKRQNIYEDTAIIITSDHGENIGELGLYSEHATADEPCCHIPMIIKWKGIKENVHEKALLCNIDLVPTIADAFGLKHCKFWDGMSFYPLLKGEEIEGRKYQVLGQCAHVCQRSVVFSDYLYIRTVHGGFHLWDDEMLFNIKEDPHELHDLKKERPDLVNEGAHYIINWEYEMMKKSSSPVDPMWTVLKEGGPYHSKGHFASYKERLIQTGRQEAADALEAQYKNER